MGEAKRKNQNPFYFKGKLKFTFILICIVVVGFAVVDYIKRPQAATLSSYDPARSKGEEAAPLRIVEFVDFLCVECARGSNILKTFMGRYPGTIFLTVKYFPHGELNSTLGAVHAECAARQNKFWEYHNELFKKQHQWRKIFEIKPFLLGLAEGLKLNIDQFSQCIDSDEARNAVYLDRTLADALFVQATPTYFINEEMVVGVEELNKFLEEYLSQNQFDDK